MMRATEPEAGMPSGSTEEYASSRSTKFRFKSKRRKYDDHDHLHSQHSSSKRRRRARNYNSDPSYESDSKPGDHNPRQHKRRNRSPRLTVDDPTAYDDTYLPNARSTQYTTRDGYRGSVIDTLGGAQSQYMGPDEAFRASLFDALADDEGAAYWEGVYGQPMDGYPDTKQGPDGELERMTDEEYAAYVRTKMWEKTHQHLVEERERRDREREKETLRKKERERRAKERVRVIDEEREAFQRRVEESLKSGVERRTAKRWRESWEAYRKAWDELPQNVSKIQVEEEEGQRQAPRKIIPWPVQTRRWKDVSKEGVEDFFSHCPEDTDMASALKMERIRWHPDKMQQRFGADGIDPETMKLVTAVFQVVDRIWTDLRSKQSNG